MADSNMWQKASGRMEVTDRPKRGEKRDPEPDPYVLLDRVDTATRRAIWRVKRKLSNGRKIDRRIVTKQPRSSAAMYQLAQQVWEQAVGSSVRKYERQKTGDRVRDLWPDFVALPTRRGTPKSQHTRTNMESRFKNWIEPAIGDKRLCDVNTKDLQTIADAKQKKAPDSRETRAVLNAVVGLCSLAYDRGLRDQPPPKLPRLTAGTADTQATGSARHKAWNPNEYKKLCAAVKELDDEDVTLTWALGCGLGLRPGEIAALQVDDFDLDAGTLTIDRTYLTRTRGYGPPKNGHSNARGSSHAADVVPVPKSICKLVSDCVNRAGRKHWLFPARSGSKSVSTEAITDRIERICVRAGHTRRTNPHTMRHTFVTRSLDKGIPVHVVRERARHSSLAVTNTYAASSTHPVFVEPFE